MNTIYKPPADLRGLEGNELKTYIQKDVVRLFQIVPDLVCEITTGFGKTNIALLSAEANQNLYFHVIVPKLNLKEQWETKINERGIRNVKVYVINSYVMNNNQIVNPDILIVDEGHRCLNEESEYFSKLLTLVPIHVKRLILSASLSKKHKDYLASLGITNYYEITRHWAFKHNLVPYHTPINVPISLTNNEMSDYLTTTDQINKYARYLGTGNIYNPFETAHYKIEDAASILGITIGQVHGSLNKWKAAINKRKTILYNAANKKEITLEIMKYVNEKALIFCKTIESAKSMSLDDPLGVAYHSKLKDGKKNSERKEVINLFESETKPHLYSVDSIKEGYDPPKDCRWVVRVAYQSGEGDTIQITGRVSRFDEDNINKESFLINLYVMDFRARGELVQSKELEWLRKNQSSQHNVIWFDNAVDAIEFIKQALNKEE